MEIYFAQIREDSRVERDLLLKRNPLKIAVIGSGGCTAFSVLSDKAEKVYCIDINLAQCALVELKKAGIKAFEREAFLAFIGEAHTDNRLVQYSLLREQLPKYAQNFWDANTAGIEMGINKCGVTERFYSFISQNILEHIYDEQVWQQLFKCQSVAEQVSIFNKYFSQEEWLTAMLGLLSKTNHLRFFPAFMFAQAQEDDFGRFFLYQFEKELKSKLVRDNYFLSQFLFGKYLEGVEEGLPYYLTAEGYKEAKRNLDKLEVIPKPVNEVLEQEKGIDAFFLSNVFDWTTAETRTAICNSMITSAAENAVVLYRNMLSEPQLPDFFSAKFKVDKELSEYCHNRERSMLYRKLTVGEIV